MNMQNDLANTTMIKKMDAYCEHMSQTIAACLGEADIEHYQSFLDMMYHYTLASGNRLAHAAKQALHPEIKKVFAELAREEQYHYRLAEADLHAFALKPSEEIPPAVTNFHQFWMNITAEEEYQYVGALYVLENVARFIQPHLMPHFARLGIGPERARFVLTHLVADEDHGDKIMALCQHADGEAEQLLYSGAEKASEFWIDIHKHALSVAA
jgi:rubrerythrin